MSNISISLPLMHQQWTHEFTVSWGGYYGLVSDKSAI